MLKYFFTNKVCTLLSSSDPMTFNDFFDDLSTFSVILRLINSVTFDFVSPLDELFFLLLLTQTSSIKYV